MQFPTCSPASLQTNFKQASKSPETCLPELVRHEDKRLYVITTMDGIYVLYLAGLVLDLVPQLSASQTRQLLTTQLLLIVVTICLRVYLFGCVGMMATMAHLLVSVTGAAKLEGDARNCRFRELD